ncbi:hypothetical protein OG21DRAFT_1135191 [Imleria badia]|nr:hypothetical protein OG21DRAFT_1135191 [Imleria badia]
MSTYLSTDAARHCQRLVRPPLASHDHDPKGLQAGAGSYSRLDELTTRRFGTASVFFFALLRLAWVVISRAEFRGRWEWISDLMGLVSARFGATLLDTWRVRGGSQLLVDACTTCLHRRRAWR